MSSEQRVVLISGGSRGLGQALATDLLGRGYRVATFSRKPSAFVEACEADPELSARFLWRAVDGTDTQALKALVREVDSHFGRLDVLINNAAYLSEGVLTLASEVDIHRTVALNLESVLQLTRFALRPMLRVRGGCVINVSSINAVRGHRGVVAYSATKAAMDGMTRSLAREMGPKGVRVNSVAPGYFDSEMTGELTEEFRARVTRRTPLRRLGAATDMAGVIRFLISEDAAFITGQTLVVDGGYTC